MASKWWSPLVRPVRRMVRGWVTRVHLDLFDWYSENFYPLREALTEAEWAYILGCLTVAETFWEMPENQEYDEYSYFTYSHRVRGDEVNSSRVAFGSVANPHEALKLAGPVFAERGLALDPYFLEDDNSLFYGLGWDFVAGHFKVYFRVLDFDKLPQEGLRSLLEQNAYVDRRPEGLVSYTYMGGELHEEKVYMYPKPEANEAGEIFPGTKGRVLMATTRRGVITQYDVSSTKQWRSRLNEAGQEVMRIYAKKGLTLDTIAMQDNDNFTLYFPGAFDPFLKLFS